MTTYNSQTLITNINCSGITLLGTDVYYADYGSNTLFKIDAIGNNTSLVSLSGTLKSIGIYGNTIYLFSSSGHVGIYPIGSSLSEYWSFDAISIQAIGNVFLSSPVTAYVASEVISSNNSSVYKFDNINQTSYSVTPIITFSGLNRKITGVTSDGTNLYVASIRNNEDGVGVISKFNLNIINATPPIVTDTSYDISSISVGLDPLTNIDCFYTNNLLYVLFGKLTSSSDSHGGIFSFNSDGSFNSTIILSTLSQPNTFTAGVNGRGIRFFVSDNALFGYGLNIQKVYDSAIGSSIGGDPHIQPLLNDDVYILPNNNNSYNYFDNFDNDERLIINSKQWVIDYNFIANMTNISENKNINKYIKYDNNSSYDSAFNKYIFIVFKNEHIIVDMESLNFVLYDEYKIKTYELCDDTDYILKCSVNEIFCSEIDYSNKYEYIRNIKINTKKFGAIDIKLSYYPYRKNHRNDFLMKIENCKNLSKNCSGCAIDINTLHEIPSLTYIDDTLIFKKYDVEHIMTLEKYKIFLTNIEKQKMKKMKYV